MINRLPVNSLLSCLTIKMMSDIYKHPIQMCKHNNTRASATMHHSSNSHFILSGDNSRIIFSYCPYLSPKNITLLINKVSFRIIKIDKYMIYQFIFIKL